MSVQALSWVLDNSESEHSARLVLISIANHADKYGQQSWPSVRAIGEESRLSERVVRSAIAELEKIGEIAVQREAGPGRSNVYSLLKMHPANYAPLQKTTAEGAEYGSAIRNNRPEPSLLPLELKRSIRRTDSPEERIYALYPRKAAPRDAVKAIASALKRLPIERRGKADQGLSGEDWLARRVKVFADSTAGHAGEFVPYPATWFNGSRYLEEESEWNRSRKVNTNGTDRKTGALQNSHANPERYTHGADLVID